MLILAIDTALASCGVALVRDGRALAAVSEPMERGHAERLAPIADAVMREAGVAFGAIDRIAVTVGPGSFTGVRVGLSFARALALALARPCVGVSTLEALSGEREERRGGVIGAGGEVYVALYDGDDVVQAPARLSIEAARALPLAGAVMRGPGADLLAAPGVRNEPVVAPDPVSLARLAAGRDPSHHPPSPQYLRAPGAKLPGGKAPP